MSKSCVLVAQATSAGWALGAVLGFQLCTEKEEDVKDGEQVTSFSGTEKPNRWLMAVMGVLFKG